jgi:predicted RecB family nuclease
VLNVPTLRNPELGLLGRPDGIDMKGGVLKPIEIKSHRDVSRLDRLELAFYWLLLEPYRTIASEPAGQVLVRRDGLPVAVDAAVSPFDLDRVRELVDAVRGARRDGVIPEMCSCEVCVTRPEVFEGARDRKDIRLLWEIGPKRSRALRAVGIDSWERLLNCETAIVLEQLRENGTPISPRRLEKCQHHARSYSCDRPQLFGNEPPKGWDE